MCHPTLWRHRKSPFLMSNQAPHWSESPSCLVCIITIDSSQVSLLLSLLSITAANMTLQNISQVMLVLSLKSSIIPCYSQSKKQHSHNGWKALLIHLSDLLSYCSLITHSAGGILTPGSLILPGKANVRINLIINLSWPYFFFFHTTYHLSECKSGRAGIFVHWCIPSALNAVQHIVGAQ